MKRKFLSKMFAMAMATAMVIGSNGLSALAADGTEADAPQGGVGNPSSGEATVVNDTSTGGLWYVENDDDDKAKENDTETDISIWAKVVEHGDYVYKVDIAWGAMKFEFKNQTGTWDTDNHQYVNTQNGAKGWTETGYINGTNNKIEVVNHSNWAVDATFEYNHDGTAFNALPDGDDAVRGHFFKTNADAVTASKVLQNSANVVNPLVNDDPDAQGIPNQLTLGHWDNNNDNRYGGEVDEYATGSHTREVFFTFNGTPDEQGLDDALKTDFTKVGVITVTIEPWSATP